MMNNHDAVYNVASVDGGGTKTPTVNNNSVVEKTSEAFYAEKQSDSMERVFALDYEKLRQNFTFRLWFTGIYFVFLAAFLVLLFSFGNQDFLTDPSWIAWMVLCFLSFGGTWALLYRNIYRARRTIHQQRVTLTTTGIRYDKHNFPDGSTFHTTIHVRVLFPLSVFVCLLVKLPPR
jgi:hypothetical protein